MSLRVLVVDDDPMTLHTVRRILRRAGHETEVLEGGFGFATSLRRFAPDVVLLDVNMPGLGGIGALRSARELHELSHARPRIILHSGCSPQELEQTCQAVNADGYVRKPASSEALLAAVDPGNRAATQPPAQSAK